MDAFASALRTLLGGQRDSRFFLAKTMRESIGYERAGQHYWIVGYHPDRQGREVSWVSADYFIYQDSVTDFDLTAPWLAARFSA